METSKPEDDALTTPQPFDLPDEAEPVMLPGQSLQTNLVKPVFEELGQSQGTSAEDLSLQPVLDKLDSLGQQLDGLIKIQRSMESIVRQAHPQIEPIIQPDLDTRSSLMKRHTECVGSAIDLGIWKKDWEQHKSSVASLSALRRATTSRVYCQEENRQSGWLRALHPDSWPKALMDSLSLLVLMYDSLVIPYQLAFHLPFEGWVAVVSWSTVAFWFVDLIMGFFLAYRETDRVVTDLRRIGLRYLRRGFLPSFAVWLADLLGNLQQLQSNRVTGSNAIKVLRFLKLHRLARISSLFRTGKVADARDWLATLLREWGMNEHFDILMRIVVLVFYILWANHVGGCLWHIAVGDVVPRWVREQTTITEDEGVFGYMFGFYVTATAMIAGGTVVTPSSLAELSIQVLYVVAGFILSSVLISSLLAAVMEFQDANKERNANLKSLRQFLFQHRIDRSLAVPLVNQVYDRMGKKKQLGEGDIQALSLVSPNLRAELWSRIYGPSLKTNPVLCAFGALAPKMIQEICTEALEHHAFKPGAPVFSALVEALGPSFVCSGDLEYTPAYAFADPVPKTLARKGDWISEAAFWIHWQHRGWLDARTPCEVMTVEAQRFGPIVSKSPELARLVQSYSDSLLRTLKSLGPHVSDLDTLPHQTVVSGMPLDSRIVLSQIALESLSTRAWTDSLSVKAQWSGGRLNQTQVSRLTQEVHAGTCDLVMTSEGVQRATTIVALCLSRGDGAILAQLGRCREGAVTVACELPGTKVKSGEMPKAVIEHLAQEKLPQLYPHLQIGHYRLDNRVKVSPRYGLKSLYVRMVFDTHMSHEPDEYKKLLAYRVPLQRASSARQSHSEQPYWLTSKGKKPHKPVILQDLEAFTLEYPEDTAPSSKIIYAWLGPEDFDFFSSPAGEEHLRRMVLMLELPEDELAGAPPLPESQEDVMRTVEHFDV